jgi:hypothetical protein
MSKRRELPNPVITEDELEQLILNKNYSAGELKISKCPDAKRSLYDSNGILISDEEIESGGYVRMKPSTSIRCAVKKL